MTTFDDLPPFELGFPGEQRDRLVAAVLSGAKTSTTGLLRWYEAMAEPLPEPGTRMALVDSREHPLAVLEMTEVRVLRLAEVELRHALDEGEGFASVAEWRSAHEGFWHSGPLRAELGDPGFTADDDTLVVMERFALVEGPGLA
ncbi:ASCH domain-containing protein [Streptomyces sp. NBC_00249]|uniref:ASCH domain-containing protein n=1 Tax=Streptomyces sp. NBC_00249 TaxID=2975690 RepID=UPI0022594898|nr:ASCH domain-containing protein [Streptomyces sp. NBC_00249]MCX5197683.1 ASCH domain-containing protein [Streptomyces sp. NBC_00249]